MKPASLYALFVLLVGLGPLACARHIELDPDGSGSHASSRTNSEETADLPSQVGTGGRGAAPMPSCLEDVDGSSAPSALALGPNNRVFAPAHIRADGVVNYQDERVFEGPVLGLTANFTSYKKLEAHPEEFAITSQRDALMVPGRLATLLDYVGEVRLTPAGCDGAVLAGRHVRVELLWKLDDAIVESIPQGVALGTVEAGGLVTFPGAIVSRGDDAQRLLNGLQPTVLEHTFDAAGIEGDGLYLRLWALTRDGVHTTLYINSVEWD